MRLLSLINIVVDCCTDSMIVRWCQLTHYKILGFYLASQLGGLSYKVTWSKNPKTGSFLTLNSAIDSRVISELLILRCFLLFYMGYSH